MAQELVLKIDAFGNATKSASIGYPRRASDVTAEPEQQKTWVLVTTKQYANRPDEPGWYRVGVPVETVTSELTGLAAPAGSAYTAQELMDPMPGYTERVVECQRQLDAREYATGTRAFADADGPLDPGEITERAIPHHALRLAYTTDLLQATYAAAQPAESELRLAGYVKEAEGYWAKSGRVVLDPEHFYTPMGAVDSFDAAYHVDYDAHWLLPVETRDPLENRTTVGIRVVETVMSNGNDYRVLAPAWVTDPNGNQTRVAFDGFGRVVRAWKMGKYSDNEGDDEDHPGAYYNYDLHAWEQGRGPASVHAVLRENHQQGDEPFDAQQEPVRQGFQHARTWTDGFGREVMTKVQAEKGPVPVIDSDGKLEKDSLGDLILVECDTRWVGTGRTVFDNKGNPVKKYEPFFTDSLEYETEQELVEWGVTPILHYDPLGRLVRTDEPNGTYSEVRFDTWRQDHWDANDTVSESLWYQERGSPDPRAPEPAAPEGRAAWLAAKHARTPKVEYLDGLGRVFLTEEDAGNSLCRTCLELDVKGNTLSVTDARGVKALSRSYDLLGRPIRSASADAGENLAIFDARDKPFRTWAPGDYARRHLYDELERPTHLYVKRGSDAEKLLERQVYGEGHAEAELRNLRGQLHLSYDGAGVRAIERHDFKGNEIETARRLARKVRESADWSALSGCATIAAVTAAAEASLEVERLTTMASFDALGRLVARTTPDASVTSRTYNEAGLLETILVNVRGDLTARTVVENIDYNARGQREAVVHGNGAETSFTYDPKTFRLTRQLTQKSGGETLQDLSYTYDPVGNIMEVRDAVSFGNDAVAADGRYEYDALYRLTRATGREHPGQQVSDADAAELGMPTPHPNDWQALTRYEESYQYDDTGNLTSMAHQSDGGAGNSWTRRYKYDPGSNRLIGTSLPEDGEDKYSLSYAHDAAGNMSLPHLPRMAWDHASRLVTVTKQVGGTGPNEVCCAYDAAGQRVRKAYVHSGIIEERVYLGDYEVFRQRTLEVEDVAGDVDLERQTLHVMDGASRVLMVETKTVDTSTEGHAPTTWSERFQLGNHLGSSCMELDASGEVISYEEYHPFGSSAFRAMEGTCEVSAKRYRHTGKERDEETGLYYFGARYFAAWLGRWISADPAGMVDGPNLYAYAKGNPVRFVDPTGMAEEEPSPKNQESSRSDTKDAPKQPVVVAFYDPNILGGPRLAENEETKMVAGMKTAILNVADKEGRTLRQRSGATESNVVMIPYLNQKQAMEALEQYKGQGVTSFVMHMHGSASEPNLFVGEPNPDPNALETRRRISPTMVKDLISRLEEPANFGAANRIERVDLDACRTADPQVRLGNISYAQELANKLAEGGRSPAVLGAHGILAVERKPVVKTPLLKNSDRPIKIEGSKTLAPDRYIIENEYGTGRLSVDTFWGRHK